LRTTPNDLIRPGPSSVATSKCGHRGVNPGNPADDGTGNNLRPPNVYYTVTDPIGNVWTTTSVRNSEWELYRIAATSTLDPDPGDATATAILPASGTCSFSV